MSRPALTVTFSALLLAVGLPAGTGAGAAPARRQLTDQQIAALSPARQAALLQPLRRLAGDLDALGRSRWSGTYAGVALDAPARAVSLFVTSPAAGRALIAAARHRDPAASWHLVRVRPAAYSRARLDAAARRLMSERRGITAVSVAADGSGLDARVISPVRAVVDAGTRVPVRVRHQAAGNAKSWADWKWHDSTPFIGGDELTSNGHNSCTAGLPAVRRRGGHPVMVTAAHCFGLHTRVYTGGGRTGAFYNGRTGNYVGTVTAQNRTWDAELLDGANNNADESDTSRWLPLTSVAYSYEGDYVCQNGAASFFLGHPTPCGIKVTDDDLYFTIGAHLARGVEGIDVRNGWGSHNGDSGGTVFAVEPHGARQARGIVSSGGADGTDDQRRVDWTEAVDIFRYYGLKLNPHT